MGLARIGRGSRRLTGPLCAFSVACRTGPSRERSPRLLELVGQAKAGLRAAGVEAGEAPGLEDRRAVAPWGDEVALCEVDRDRVAQEPVDGKERLQVELVGRV